MAKQPEPKKGAPAYMLTFADLMSLLLTFFVLLLSMSEIDATRFRKVTGSLKNAFGVQRREIFDEPPKGSSFIQQEYSPGSPSRAPLSIGGATANIIDPQLQQIKNKMEKQERIAQLQKQKLLDENLKKVFAMFEKEWKAGLIEIDKDKKDGSLVLRIAERAAFSKNRTRLQSNFQPMLEKLIETASEVHGDIVIVGHSDDKIIKTAKFKSNWEFSVARANTLAQALMNQGDVDPNRVTVRFHGPTKPLVRNNSDLNRGKNRRIEVIIRH